MVVKEVMVKKPVAVDPSSNIEDAALIMRDKKLGSLLVTENGSLVGIITQTDVFDKLISVFARQEPALSLRLMTG